jgi:hypothetical protein
MFIYLPDVYYLRIIFLAIVPYVPSIRTVHKTLPPKLFSFSFVSIAVTISLHSRYHATDNIAISQYLLLRSRGRVA